MIRERGVAEGSGRRQVGESNCVPGEIGEDGAWSAG